MAIASWTRTKEHVWSNLLISLESFSIDAGIQECILQRSTCIYPWNFQSNLVNKKSINVGEIYFSWMIRVLENGSYTEKKRISMNFF